MTILSAAAQKKSRQKGSKLRCKGALRGFDIKRENIPIIYVNSYSENIKKSSAKAKSRQKAVDENYKYKKQESING